MKIPFTVERFFAVFGAYNIAIRPAQILVYILGIIVIALAFRENKVSGRIIGGIPALFWIWRGVFYQLMTIGN